MSFNRVTLLGTVADISDFEEEPSIHRPAKFIIMTVNKYRKGNGKPDYIPDFHHVWFYSKKVMNDLITLKTGSNVFVDGHLKTHRNKNKDGTTTYLTYISASRVDLMNDTQEQNLIGMVRKWK